MKNCELIKEQIHEYIDFALTRAERMEVEAHLEECADCRAYYAQMEMLFGLPEPVVMSRSVAGEVSQRIHSQLEDESDAFADQGKRLRLAQKLEKRRNLRAWTAIAAVLVLTLGTWAFSRYWDWGAAYDKMAGAEGSKETVENSFASADSETSSVTGAEDGSGTQPQGGDTLWFSSASTFAERVRKSSAVIIKFGIRPTGVTDNAFIDYFAEYISRQPTRAYTSVGAAVGLGSITLEPDSGYIITITGSYTLLVDDGTNILEILCNREELLEVFEVLGV